MINICIASDKNYWDYMSTTVVSILKTSNKSDNIHFYILCDDIPDLKKQEFETLKRFKDFQVDFIDLDIKEFKDFPKVGPHISNTSYFRYKIAELCPNISKIIYLDCDIIVKKSLAKLFETDLSGYYLAGVEDVGYVYARTINPEYLYKEGFYINAGVLLINLGAWRENNIFEKLVDFTIREADKIRIGDQDVINQVCFGKIKKLDYEWNVQDSFYRNAPEREQNPNLKEIIEAKNNPAIIHYTFKIKPWSKLSMPKAMEWQYYNSLRLGIYKLILFYIKLPFVNFYIFMKNFVKHLFSVKNSTNKSHKIITICGFKIKIKRLYK